MQSAALRNSYEDHPARPFAGSSAAEPLHDAPLSRGKFLKKSLRSRDDGGGIILIEVAGYWNGLVGNRLIESIVRERSNGNFCLFAMEKTVNESNIGVSTFFTR